MVKIFNYGNYKNDNYGSSRAVVIGSLTLYFSYKTVVAVHDRQTGKRHISENTWGSTTGRHINCINRDKSIRLNRSDFEQKLNSILDKYNLKEVA